MTVDDCGVVLNTTVVDAQAYGSAVQGIGRALYEGMRLSDDGVPALQNGLLDYLKPTYTEIPSIAPSSRPSYSAADFYEQRTPSVLSAHNVGS